MKGCSSEELLNELKRLRQPKETSDPLKAIKERVDEHGAQLLLMTQALSHLGETVHSLLKATEALNNALTAHLESSNPKPATDRN